MTNFRHSTVALPYAIIAVFKMSIEGPSNGKIVLCNNTEHLTAFYSDRTPTIPKFFVVFNQVNAV